LTPSPDTPHPLVDRGSLRALLDDLEKGAQERLAIERAKPAPKAWTP